MPHKNDLYCSAVPVPLIIERSFANCSRMPRADHVLFPRFYSYIDTLDASIRTEGLTFSQ